MESWVLKLSGSTEYFHPAGLQYHRQPELAWAATRTNAHGQSQTTDVVLQGKMVLRPLQDNGWGLALAAGSVGHPQAAARRDWYAYAPVSFSLRDDALQVHAMSAGCAMGRLGVIVSTWGLGTEIQLSARAWLLAETFGQNQAAPCISWGCAIRWCPIACSSMPPMAIAMARTCASVGFPSACA